MSRKGNCLDNAMMENFFGLMKERVDSLLGGPKDVCLDSARAIGERILHNDTIKNDLRRRQDVLEILAYTARMKKDTTG